MEVTTSLSLFSLFVGGGFCPPDTWAAGCCTERGKTSFSNELIRPVPALALLNTRKFGENAGTPVGEAQNPGPATHDRDWTVTEQPNASHRRLNEARDSVPSSQGSVTRAAQNLHIPDSPAAPAALPAPPPPTMRNARRPPQPKQKPREHLRCAQCGPVADAHLAATDGGLMQHTEQKHGGQVLPADSVERLRLVFSVALSDRSVVAGATLAGATLLSANFALGTPSRTDDSPGIRTQQPAVRQPVSNFLGARSQRLQANLWSTARFWTF